MSSSRHVNAGICETLLRRVEGAVEAFDKAGIAELVELYRNPWRMLWLNLISGMARGFGIAIGVSLVSALFVAIIVRLAALNLPIIGEFIASIAGIVQYEMSVP
ncbi:MAG: hypothetical protein GX161_10075 [Firmicutes bacterium]|jgi:hypothetical protein|nr:hypothetical protein [Bacillota bacterium]